MTPKTRKSGQSITAHRLFPALVALWFAALFGLGSFAVQPQLLERIVAATPLPALVPAAAPPLGLTARLLVALAMTGLGLGLGLAIGLRLRPRTQATTRRRTAKAETPPASTESPRTRHRDAHPDAPVCTPLVLSDDLLTEGVGQVDADAEFVPFRRRALPVADDAQVIEEAVFDEAVFEETGPEGKETIFAAEVQPAADSATPSPPRFAIPAPIVPGAPRSPLALASLDSLGLVQLIERLALAIAERQALLDGDRDAQAQTAPAQAAQAQTEWPTAPRAEPQTVQSPSIARSPLMQRAPLFQRALSGAFPAGDAERHEVDAGSAAPAAEPDNDTDASGIIIPSPFSPLVEKPIQRIVSLRPAPFDGPALVPDMDEDEDDDEGFAIPRFLGGAPVTPVEAEDLDEIGDEIGDDLPEPPLPEDRYSSLVDMHPPLPRPEAYRQEFICTEDAEGNGLNGIEPVVVFPGQGPFTRPTQASPAIPHARLPDPVPAPDPAETDRALRAALITLQRMTAKG